MKNSTIYFGFLLISIVMSGCKKSGDQPKGTAGAGQVFLCNEGNFGWGNGEISRYNAESREVENQIFQTINSFSPGDVVQSMAEDSNYYYVVVNNAARILAVRKQDFVYSHTINIPGSSPRFLLVVPGNKAYVSDLYANRLWILNLSSRAVSGFIPMNGWTEEMVQAKGKVYVAVRSKPGGPVVQELAILNPATDQVESVITLSGVPVSISKESEEHIWLLTEPQSGGARLMTYATAGGIWERDSLVSGISSPKQIRCMPGQIYILAGAVYRYQQGSMSLFASANGRNWYSLGVNTATGEVYVSDVKDYQQESRVYRYRSTGEEEDQFDAGIITGYIYFSL
jgi:hypothetical protein